MDFGDSVVCVLCHRYVDDENKLYAFQVRDKKIEMVALNGRFPWSGISCICECCVERLSNAQSVKCIRSGIESMKRGEGRPAREVLDDLLEKLANKEKTAKKSPIFCAHANEMPASCPCDDDCYCKEHSCKPKQKEK